MEYLNIYSNCQIVKGASMALICDLQLKKYYHIPNDMADALLFLQQNSISKCIEDYGIDNEKTIKQYIKFITDKELGFIDNQIMTELTPLDLSWDRCSEITNVIIEYNASIDYDTKFFNDLFELNVQGLEIRFYEEIDLDSIVLLVKKFNGTSLSSIKLVLPFTEKITNISLEKLANNYPRVKSFMLHSAPNDGFIKIFDNSVPVVYFTQPITSCLACGLIRPDYFLSNMELFTESQQHNTCLNRKLSIDTKGEIKKCPSLPGNFGHIKDASLTEVLANDVFNRYNNIRKDDILVCKDCEFRHVCTDCRAYIEDPNDIFSKPLKCGYDPYANSWDDWSVSPLKQNTIAYYGLDKLSTI